MEMPLTDTGSLWEEYVHGWSWMGSLGHKFHVGHSVVGMPVEHPSKNTHHAVVYLSLEAGLARYISMSMVLRRVH